MFGHARARAAIGGRRWPVRIALALAAALSVASVAPIEAATAFTLQVPVLMYHHVLPPSLVPPHEPEPGLYVDPVTFDAQLRTLRAHGWHTVTARVLADALTAGRPLPGHTFVITFDDGRPDQYTYAFPILRKYGFVATFFIVPGRIGESQAMTVSEIQALAAAGNEIANHTLDHVPLTALTADQMRTQIRSASDAIQAITGVRPITFAYPFGAFDPLAEWAASAEGMAMAFTTLPGADETAADRMHAPRIRVAGVHYGPGGVLEGGTTATDLLALVSAPPRTTLQTARFVVWTGRPIGLTAPAYGGGLEPPPMAVTPPAAAAQGPSPAPLAAGATAPGGNQADGTQAPLVGLALGVGALGLAGLGLLRRRRGHQAVGGR